MQPTNTISSLYRFRNNEKFVQTRLADYLLMHIFSPAVLSLAAEKWETLPPYIRAEVPDQVLKIAFETQSDKSKQMALCRYWLEKSVRVLTAYSQAPVPYSKDPKVSFDTVDLLSTKGKQQLDLLQNKLQMNDFSAVSERAAIKGAHKFLLDISLFKNFNRLKSSTFYLRPQFGRVVLSLSSGCYNMCAHCGFAAKPPVSHLPYPVFVRLAHLYGRQLRSPYSGLSQFYSNSDPLSYRDDILDVDVGDVCRYVQTCLPTESRLRASIVTKGALFEKDLWALAKAFESNSVSLSFVDLPGERNIGKNWKRILTSLSALSQVSKDRQGDNKIEFRHVCLPDDTKEKNDFLLDDDTLFRKLFPVFNGRWVETSLKQNLPFAYRGRKVGFSMTQDIVISSNGNIYDCRLKPGATQFTWKKVDNIFRYMERD